MIPRAVQMLSETRVNIIVTQVDGSTRHGWRVWHTLTLTDPSRKILKQHTGIAKILFKILLRKVNPSKTLLYCVKGSAYHAFSIQFPFKGQSNKKVHIIKY